MTIYLQNPLFVENLATDEYRRLINIAIERTPSSLPRITAKSIIGYCELHHIVPQSIGGPDNTANTVWLTAYEHLKAHLLLTKMTVDKSARRSLNQAAIRMATPQDNKHERVSIKDLTDSDLLHLATIKEEWAAQHSEYMRERVRGENNPFFRKKHSEVSNQSRRDKMTGFKRTDENKELCRLAKLGDKNPARRVITCPCCGSTGKSGGMRKYHFEYCIEGLRFWLLHEDGRSFTGTREEFIYYACTAKWQHNEIGGLLRGSRKEFKGWRVVTRLTTNVTAFI